MDTDNREGTDCGLEVQAGWREQKGKNWDNLNKINKQKKE